jgi:release factor glutamine methyltransferase
MRNSGRSTIREALATGGAELARAGIEDAALESRLLLGAVLDRPHLEVGLSPGEPLSAEQLGRYQALLQARCARQPLQHLLGEVDFYGHQFRVRPGVFIPRPETEAVTAVALDLLPSSKPARIAEVGSGTGVIAVTIALERPAAEVWCCDLDHAAVALTRENARLLGVGARIHALEGEGLTALAAWAPFDFVVSNPPYIPSDQIDALEPEVRDHDPRTALDGGTDGLVVTRALIREAQAHLAPGGHLVVELGDDQADTAAALASEAGYQHVTVALDLAGRQRILCATQPT